MDHTRRDLSRARRAVGRAIKLCVPILTDGGHVVAMRLAYKALGRFMRALPARIKPRGKGIKTLTKELDDVFSVYVRLGASDDQGMIRCYTCSAPHHWTQMDNGHFIGRQYTMIRWDRKNTRPQCRSCNRFGEGNKGLFRDRLVAEVGEQQVLWLEANQKKRHHSRTELEVMIAHYDRAVIELKTERGIKN